MSSKGAGMANKFQDEMPQIVVTQDLCHIFSLIMKYSVAQFPTKYEEIIRSISSKFAQSPQNTY